MSDYSEYLLAAQAALKEAENAARMGKWKEAEQAAADVGEEAELLELAFMEKQSSIR